MSFSLADILQRKDYDEPHEVRAIKQYVKEHFDEDVAVTLREKEIIITTPSAALAGALRMHQYQMQKAAETKSRLILRIGY